MITCEKSSMVQVREGSLADNIDAMDALFSANWAETGFDFPLKLDKERYKQFEALGILVIIGAFDGDRVVGYSLASVLPHPFNPEMVFCNSDVMFLLSEYRNTTAGARLIAETKRVAKARGASKIFWHARGDSKFADMLRNRGHHLADEVFMEDLNYGS